MEEQEIPFWDYKNKDADNILPIDFLEKAAQEMFNAWLHSNHPWGGAREVRRCSGYPSLTTYLNNNLRNIRSGIYDFSWKRFVNGSKGFKVNCEGWSSGLFSSSGWPGLGTEAGRAFMMWKESKRQASDDDLKTIWLNKICGPQQLSLTRDNIMDIQRREGLDEEEISSIRGGKSRKKKRKTRKIRKRKKNA